MLIATREIGKGAYGHVYDCYDKNNPEQRYAVKRFITLIASKEAEIVDVEYNIAKNLKHPSVVEMYALLFEHGCTYIIMEMCDTDLSNINPKGLDKQDIFNIMVEITSGLRYMQALSTLNIKADVVHRDLKPANILLKVGKIKITDFGVSKM
jgi:serine/threonine protein kinase